MSESTPDLSKVVSLIMENPSLIEQISGLVKSEMKENTTTPEEKNEGVPSEKSEKPPTEVAREASVLPGGGTRQNRARLMSALKPYVSEGRQKALDSFLSIADILDMMRSR